MNLLFIRGNQAGYELRKRAVNGNPCSEELSPSTELQQVGETNRQVRVEGQGDGVKEIRG